MNQPDQLIEAVVKSARSGSNPDDKKQLTCAEAFELAQKYETEIAEIGRICNQHKIKIRNCQLGCFT